MAPQTITELDHRSIEFGDHTHLIGAVSSEHRQVTAFRSIGAWTGQAGLLARKDDNVRVTRDLLLSKLLSGQLNGSAIPGP
jgi:hypothetical protein